MANTKKSPAFERFAVSHDAIAIALREYEAPNVVLAAKADLMALFKANGIEAHHFMAPKLESEKTDNEWIAARDWLWKLAANVVLIDGVRLDAEGVAKVFDDSVGNAAMICGAQKAGVAAVKGRTWKNRINNQVGDKWGKNVFGAALAAEEKAALAAEAANATPVELSDEQKAVALLEENQTWFNTKLNELFRRTHKEAGAFIEGDMTALQAAIAAAAAEVGKVRLSVK